MALYDVKNLKTGETKSLNLSLENYEKWREENPDWDKDWMAGVASAVSGVGDFQKQITTRFQRSSEQRQETSSLR